MKVRITRPDLAGRFNLCYEVGEEINLPDAQAKELIEDGYAIPVGKVEDASSKAKRQKAIVR